MNDYDRIAKVLHYLDREYRRQPLLAELAKVAGVSESHFHRLFTQWARVTPKDFLQALTAEHAKACLARSRSVLESALAAGLSGPGRLHDLLVHVEAMSPGEWKARGEGLEIRYGLHESPFGLALVGVTRRGVAHLSFLDSPKSLEPALAEMKSKWERAAYVSDPSLTRREARMIFEEGKGSVLLAGTPFQLKVWKALLRVPAGHLVSYGALARATGSEGASRAVGSAVGQNSVAYLIPCHRVIRETGALGGYRWGTKRKQAMLALELSRPGEAPVTSGSRTRSNRSA